MYIYIYTREEINAHESSQCDTDNHKYEVKTLHSQHAWYFADEAIEVEQIERFGTLSHISEITADQFMGQMPAEVERLMVLNSCLPDLKFP